MTRIPEHPDRIGLRLAQEHRAVIEEAARLRGWTLSDYIRQRFVPVARQDVLNAKPPRARGAGQ